jgi:hypothetical protein
MYDRTSIPFPRASVVEAEPGLGLTAKSIVVPESNGDPKNNLTTGYFLHLAGPQIERYGDAVLSGAGRYFRTITPKLVVLGVERGVVLAQESIDLREYEDLRTWDAPIILDRDTNSITKEHQLPHAKMVALDSLEGC